VLPLIDPLEMIFETLIGKMFPRLPKQYIFPGLMVLLFASGISALWIALKSAHAAEVQSLKKENDDLKSGIKYRDGKIDSLYKAIIFEKISQINVQAEDIKVLELKKEQVDNYIYENRLRDEILRRKSKSVNTESKRLIKEAQTQKL
jgi:hypothetical protein